MAVIHQELHLVPEMTVAENLFLGHLPTRWGVVKRGLLRKQALASVKTMMTAETGKPIVEDLVFTSFVMQ